MTNMCINCNRQYNNNDMDKLVRKYRIITTLIVIPIILVVIILIV